MNICPNKDTCEVVDYCKDHAVKHEENEKCKASSYCPACVEVNEE